MKKEIKVVDQERNIIQVTTYDERWYMFEGKDKTTNLPKFKFLPSVTWICEYYPKGIAFYKWLANKGWDEAEAIKIAAGDKGSKVHQAIGDLLDDKTIKMTTTYFNPTTGQQEELTVEEYECILSFANWFKATKPIVKAREFVVVNKKEQYAGMVDLLCEISGQLYIIDIKTSPNIWPSHELQVSAYKHAGKSEPDKSLPSLAILQVGYRRNKRHYKFTGVEDKYPQFLAAKTIWANETKGITPLQRDYPLSIQLESEIENEDKHNSK